MENNLKKTHNWITLPYTWNQGNVLNLLCVLCLVTQLCLCDPMDCSPPGASVHGDSPGKNTRVDLHAPSRESSQPRDRTQVSCIAGTFFTVWATRAAQIYCTSIKKKKEHYKKRERNGMWWLSEGTQVTYQVTSNSFQLSHRAQPPWERSHKLDGFIWRWGSLGDQTNSK